MIKKIYLSRAQTRSMAAEHPIGDPTGGPAYGEKNDPISAAISIGTMFATAEAGFAAMTLMQGITFAGAAVSLVGNITGNKTLMKIGAIAGIAGGLGSFAESQGLFSSGNLQETLGMKSSVTDEMLRNGASSVTPGAQAPVVDGVQVNAAPDVASSVAQTSPVASPNVTARPLDINTPASAADALTTAPRLNPGINPGTDILGRPLPQMSYAPGMGPNMSVGAPAAPGFVDSLKAGNYMDAAKAAGSGAMDMLKNNPTGAYVAAQAIGGVADWLSGKTDAELDALKANTGYANAKALEVQTALDREKMRRANLNAGYTNVNAGFKVNPNAAVAQPWQQSAPAAAPTGLVAGAMQPRQG
tara:strand:- start:11 stop:1084 length:1074 start_codon:yes stop_codon:yes gene_type:complete